MSEPRPAGYQSGAWFSVVYPEPFRVDMLDLAFAFGAKLLYQGPLTHNHRVVQGSRLIVFVVPNEYAEIVRHRLAEIGLSEQECNFG